jgi:proline iminopeptidase
MTPDGHTISEFQLDVGDGHQLYVQDWGKADARTPILLLHGGPGSGLSNRYRQRFDPKKQRVIFFDQRGAGRSLPYGSLNNNTTDDLVEDIEKILDRLKLKRIVITGGSWGSCLALAYALKHPERIEALVLQGIFTGSHEEIDFLEKGRFRDFFPDVWETFLGRTPEKYRDDPSKYHLERMFGEDEAARHESARAYQELEGALLSLDDRFSPYGDDEFDIVPPLIEAHYIRNNCFLPDRHILDNAHKLKMPVWLIQGRYDAVCPPKTAYELSKRLPDAKLTWTAAGHGNDRPNYEVMRTILMQWEG